jgi:hypothetical protein
MSAPPAAAAVDVASVRQFCEATQANEAVARRFLARANGKVAVAINAFMDEAGACCVCVCVTIWRCLLIQLALCE